jgi:hypothetical protein
MQIIKNNLLPAPIALFCFNRPVHLQTTIEYLKRNPSTKESDLFVFSDGPRANSSEDLEKVTEVRVLLSQISGFKSVKIIENMLNKGLASSIIDGLNMVFEDHGQVIVLEDDILVSEDFLDFMNEGISKYENVGSIFSISGYSFQLNMLDFSKDLNLVKRASSWGWGTWRNEWQSVDWAVETFPEFKLDKAKMSDFKNAGNDQLPMLIKQQFGLISSWAVRWTYHHYLKNGFCVVPKLSKVKNIGTDGSGTNFNQKTRRYDTVLNNQIINFPEKLEEDIIVTNFIRNYYTPSSIRRFINWMKFGV